MMSVINVLKITVGSSISNATIHYRDWHKQRRKVFVRYDDVKPVSGRIVRVLR